jgi:penicillin-insensitive murein endopeptidase
VRVWCFGLVASLLAVTGPDSAAPGRTAAVVAAPVGRSIGSPNGGRLDGGARLEEGPFVRVVPFYAGSHARWGLPSLVGLLDRAARRVAHRYPDAVLAVGDLSRKGGGELDRHRSHESGRDADVAFFARTASNKPLVADRFVAFDANGAARSVPGAVFDDVRNWALIEALVEDVASRVSYIFVAAPLRARLLRYAEQHSVSRALRERAAQLMMQPRHALPHDDHFHVRIACPPEQIGTCVEEVALPTRRARPALAVLRHRSASPGSFAIESPSAWRPPPAAALRPSHPVSVGLAALPTIVLGKEDAAGSGGLAPASDRLEGLRPVLELRQEVGTASGQGSPRDDGWQTHR